MFIAPWGVQNGDMPRQHRFDFPNACHHVMNRGARRAPVLETDSSKESLLGLVAQLPGRFQVKVHAYAVLDNHFHLLLQTPAANLSAAMHHLSSRFVQRLNREQSWDGPVFRGRFRSRLVLGSAYWAHLLSYVHLNPVRAGICTTVDQAQWTSHAAYLKPAAVPPWLTVSDLLAEHDGPAGYARYVAGQVGENPPTPSGFDDSCLWSPGSGGVLVPPHSWVLGGGTGGCEQEVLAAIAHVSVVTGVSVPKLVNGLPGRSGNPARWTAAWWLATWLGFQHRTIAEVFSVNESRVAQLSSRGRLEQDLDPRVAAWAAALKRSTRG